MTVLGYYRFVDHDRVNEYLALGWRYSEPYRFDHLHEYGVTLFWPGTDLPPESETNNPDQ
jgi:hypothetical protein